MNSNTHKKKSGFVILFIVFLVFLATFGLLTIGVGYLAYRQYNTWRTEFENTHLSDDYLQTNSKVYKDADKSLQEKLVKFQDSEEQTDFVELTVDEFTVLFNEVLKESLGKDIKPQRYYVEASEGRWVVYTQLLYKKNTLPWVVITVDKDPIETPELFVSDIKMGDTSIKSYGFGSVITKINEGYSESISNINESGFTGRRWQNIELEDDGVVIKGELY